MDLAKLAKLLKDNNQPKFRLEQIRKAVYQDGVSSFLDISTISKELREKLDKEIKILSFEAEKVLVSKDKRSVKALLKIPCHSERIRQLAEKSKNLKKYKLDPSTELGMTNYFIETVLLSPRPVHPHNNKKIKTFDNNVSNYLQEKSQRGKMDNFVGGGTSWTVCISSQVGCPLNCAFCATGKGGFRRNLTHEEITDQVLFWQQYLKKISNFKFKISNLVFMGMGEPMLNLKEVKESIKDLINPKSFGFGSRSISVSTAGIPEKLKEFLEEFPQINLAISLHFAGDVMRSRWMPINKKYNLDDLRAALKDYFKKSKRKIFLEYIMFDGLNDSLKDAEKLITYLKSIGNVYLLHVNLIAYNSINSEQEAVNKNIFKPSSKNTIIKFRNYLLRNKINCTIRKSLGQDISGACGQLKGL